MKISTILLAWFPASPFYHHISSRCRLQMIDGGTDRPCIFIIEWTASPLIRIIAILLPTLNVASQVQIGHDALKLNHCGVTSSLFDDITIMSDISYEWTNALLTSV